MRRLTIVHDETCALCVRCSEWLSRQASYVPLELLGARSAEARARFAAVPWLGSELVCVSDAGEVWAGPAAFVVCLWALREYRDLSLTLSAPAFLPLAERFFAALSSRRRVIASFLSPRCDEGGSCRVELDGRHRPRAAYR